MDTILEALITRADPITWLLLVVFIIRQGRRLQGVEKVQGVLVAGHVNGVQAHRELATELPKVMQ